MEFLEGGEHLLDFGCFSGEQRFLEDLANKNAKKYYSHSIATKC